MFTSLSLCLRLCWRCIVYVRYLSSNQGFVSVSNMQGVNTNGAGSSKRAKFMPAGYRVLVVDNDCTCLTIISRMLRVLQYKVTTATKATDALSIIREREDELDLVLVQFDMPEMNEYELLEQIGKEHKLPVAIMSADYEESALLGCLTKGAVICLVKPITMNDAENVWQHAACRAKFKRKAGEEQVGSVMWVSPQEGSLHAYGENYHEYRDREKNDVHKNKASDAYSSSSTIQQKPKMVWTDKFHKKFLLDIWDREPDNAHPNNTFEFTSVPQRKKKKISNHLQKYYLSWDHGKNTQTSDYAKPFGGKIAGNSEIVGLAEMDASREKEILSEQLVPSNMENSGFAQQQQLLVPPPLPQLAPQPPPDAEQQNIVSGENGEIDEFFGQPVSPSTHWFSKNDFDELASCLLDE